MAVLVSWQILMALSLYVCNSVGDGDCGATLATGARGIEAAAAASLPLNAPAACLRGVAGAAQGMGGTSGALYNIALTAAAGERFPHPCRGTQMPRVGSLHCIEESWPQSIAGGKGTSLSSKSPALLCAIKCAADDQN